MGCGSSKSDSEHNEACTPRDKNKSNGFSNGHVKSENAKNKKIATTDANSNIQDVTARSNGKSQDMELGVSCFVNIFKIFHHSYKNKNVQ